MFEHRSQPLLSRSAFAWRLLGIFLITVLIVLASVLAGTIGFHHFVGHDWAESFHDACLVLGDHHDPLAPDSTSGQVFIGLYVMYTRLVFFTVIALLVVPIIHRVLHRLHLDEGR